MKHLLLTTIAAVLFVGCGESQQSTPSPEAKPEPTTAEAPDIPLWKAARDGNIEAVRQHFAAGTVVDAEDKDGRTPLRYTALKGHKEIAELLIAKGADVNARPRYGSTPLDWAILFEHPEIADLLRKHGGKTGEELEAANKKLTDAASNGDIEAVKQHLAAGTDVNAKDRQGWTPLFESHHPLKFS